jgi:FMN phosphatase YigB (HAD superfamily)
LKVVLFDLGDTLEIKVDGQSVLREHAIETLEEIKNMRDINDQPLVLGLASDFIPVSNDESLEEIKGKYYSILDDLQIKPYFEPLEDNVTLSSEVPETKSQNARKFFQTAIDKINNNASFNKLIFITERKHHIDLANNLGMKTIFLNLDGIPTNTNQLTITNLTEAIVIIKDLIRQ